MARMDCEDCMGSGKIETEGVRLARSRYDKKLGQMITPYVGDGNWQFTQCHCVGEEDA